MSITWQSGGSVTASRRPTVSMRPCALTNTVAAVSGGPPVPSISLQLVKANMLAWSWALPAGPA